MIYSVFSKCENPMSSYGTPPPSISGIITPKLKTSTLLPYSVPPFKISGAYRKKAIFCKS